MIDQAEGLRKMVAELRGAENERLRSSRRGRQKVIAVASGKGGVGKTGFSVNLAIAMSQEDQRVLILDADLGLSNANIVMGEMPKWNLYHVLKGEKKLSEVVSQTRHGVDLIAGGSGIHELANLTGTERQRFIADMDGLENYDIIVIDTGAGISHNVTSFLHAADQVVIITTPEPTAVTDAYGIIKALVVGGMDANIDLVVNRARSADEGRKISEHILGIAHQFLNASIHALGALPDDPAVVRALYKKTPYLIFDPKAPVSRAVHEIAAKLLSVPVREDRDGRGFLGHFRKIFGGAS